MIANKTELSFRTEETMQPPQGSNPQSGFNPGQNMGAAPDWSQSSTDQSWVQRPVQGQAWTPSQPGQAPPPVEIYPEETPYAAPGQMEADPGQETPPQPEGASTYRLPKTGVPRGRARKNKAGYLILVAVVLLLAGYAIFRMLAGNRLNYAMVRSGSMSALYSGDAVIVRDEVVYAEEGVSQIEFNVEEGSEVNRGTLVATIYKSGFNTKEWSTLQNYRDQIKAYHKVLILDAGSDNTLQKRLTEVQDRAMEVQRLVHGARGNVSLQMEEDELKSAMQRQQIYIKQKYPDDQKLARLYEDENAQLQRISTWTKQFATSSDGLVSFYTDGYEKALNVSNYADFNPTQVREMYNGKIPAVESSVPSRNSTDIYRMVRKQPWVILMLCHEKDWTPMENDEYKLVIESFDNVVLDAKVATSTRSGGELLIRLVVENTDFLPNALYLRSCQVRLGKNVNSLMVPSRAIYVQNGRKGVVIITEGGEYWTGVEVISDDGKNAYVIPDNAAVVHENVPVLLF